MNKLKSFIKRAFRSEITFGNDIKNFVNVLNTDKHGPKSEELFHGFIKSIDFNNRTLTISEQIEYIQEEATTHVVSFDRVISISRMQDGRLRMWIIKED